MVREGDHHIRYDANGRMVEKTRHQNGFRPQTTQYEWDETDRLIRVQLPNGEAWCYQYDVLGRRCRKYRQYPSEAHYQSHKPRDIHYLWQGDQLSQQQSHYADGRVVTTQWVYEPGSFRPLAQIRQLDTVNKAGELERGKPELHYAITDMAGNVKELCAPQGQVQWRSEQGLWQALYQWRLERSPKQYLEEAILDPLHCDLRHQGQIVDEETGLYYNRHRYYDPQICQYLSPDPIGLAGGTRPQAYVHNPLEWVDPFGLISDQISFKAAFRKAKRDLNIPKNVNTPKPVRVYDKKYENRTVWEFTGEHKNKFIVMHDEDKFGRGVHLHTATVTDKTIKKGYVSPTKPGKYYQHDGHIPENMAGIKMFKKGCKTDE